MLEKSLEDDIFKTIVAEEVFLKGPHQENIVSIMLVKSLKIWII